MLLRYPWKLFMKIFIKVVAVRHSKWKIFQKQTFHLTSTIYLLLRCFTLFLSLFFPNFLSFDSRVFIFFVFCISSNKLNSISCGICLSFKSRHLELFYKIIIHLSPAGIFLGLWSRVPPCNFSERLFFFAQLWMAAFNHLINKRDQKIWQVENQIIKCQIRKKN